jgi:hypothetical protein
MKNSVLMRALRKFFSVKSIILTFSLNLAAPEMALAASPGSQVGNLDDFCPIVLR